MRRQFLCIAFLLQGLGAAGRCASADPSALETVSEKLRAVTLVQADFTETKTLHILSRPLESKGTLLFSPKQGVYRVMKEPVHQELLITRAQFVQKDAEGNILRMSVRGQPAARAFVDVFLSFFAGDRRAWEKTFDAHFTGTVGQWAIEFVPHLKNPAAKALRRIVLEGREGVLDAVTVTESSGDETHTLYMNQHVSHGDSDPAAPVFPTDLKAP